MRHRRAAAPAIIALVMLTLVACVSRAGNADKPHEGNAGELGVSESVSAGASATTTAKTTPQADTREIGKTVWYDGFEITVDSVDAKPDGSDALDLTVSFTYKNLGTKEAEPAEGTIVRKGEAISGRFDSPSIPGAGTAKGTLEFGVNADSGQTLDDVLESVTLVYGDAGDNQTTIPLTASGKVDSIEPRDLGAIGKLTQGPIVIEFTSGTLAPSYKTGEEGKAVINLRFKITCGGDCGYGINVSRDDFSVTVPDGQSVLADGRSPFVIDGVTKKGEVADDADQILSFVVPLPGDGTYKLELDVSYQKNDGFAPGTLSFTI